MIDTKFLKERLEARFYPHKVYVVASYFFLWVNFKIDKPNLVYILSRQPEYSKIEKDMIYRCDKLDEVD